MYKKMISTGLVAIAAIGLASCDSDNDSVASSDVTTDTYKISFYFEDSIYQTIELEKGSYLESIPAVPTKDGYSVTWSITDFSKIQQDTKVVAELTANTYYISYYINDSIYEIKECKFGEEITPPEVTVSEGEVFSGFSGLPDTMTAGNINVYGYTYSVDEIINLSTLESDYIFEITAGGTYYFTGSNTNSGISINTNEEVNIYLEDIEVSSLKQAFIYTEKAQRVNVMYNNVLLADTAENVDESIIVSNSPIVFNGSGKIELTSLSGLGILANKTSISIESGDILVNSTSHGIQVKGKGSTIDIIGGNLDITSVGTSIKAKGDINISNATITATANADVINTEGTLIILSGTYNLTGLTDAIQADTALEIRGGDLTLSSGGGVTSDSSLTTSSDFIFEVEDTSSFTEESEYYGLYVLVNSTYIEIDEDNYNTYKNNDSFYDKKSARGLKSDGTILVSGGTIKIDSLDDGIKTDTTFNQTGGSITIDSRSDGIQGDEKIEITGGVVTINTNATFYQNSSGKYMKNGTTYYKVGSDESRGTLYDMYTSTKGLKSDTLIYIEGGLFNITSDDDGIHSNEYVTIVGGEINISTLDDGMHADSVLAIGQTDSVADLSISINNSYEGLEGANVYIYYGNINVVASDDGINAAGGSDSTDSTDKFTPGGQTGGWHKNSTATATTTEYNIYISGGNITIDALGDGIDSNGSIYISGGKTIVLGPSDNGNAAIDYGDTQSSGLYVSGGTLIAVGTSGMSQTPSTGSYVAYTLRSSVSAGSVVSIVDEDDNEILSFKTIRTCNSIIIAGDYIGSNTKYTLKVNDVANTTSSSVTK